jgi:radical SAM protein with 4Fe4S-binding SPASM domain
MLDYGRPITCNATLDRWCRQKNRILTRVQFRLLDLFGSLPSQPPVAQLYARSARRVVGAYLHSLKVELNNYCNLSCRMCYVPAGQDELPRDQVNRLFDDISGCGVRVELLGGEPLLLPGIAGIVRAAKRRARSPFVTLYTNGTPAEPALCRDLAAAGLDAAIVSLISHDPATHDSFTGHRGSHARTVAGIRHIRAAGIPVYTFTAVHALNAGQYREINRFARRDLDAHAIFYQYIPQVEDDPLLVSARAWADARHWALVEENPDHARCVRRFFELTGNACSGGNFVLTVKVDGSVQPCPFISDIPLGNIAETDIWTIYRERFSKPALVEFKSTPDECRPCAYKSVCAGGCRAGNKAVYGSYARRDGRCLGPHRGPYRSAEVTDRVPSFF